METVKLRPGSAALLILVLAAFLVVMEYAHLVDTRGSLLVTLAYWAALVQGSVAVVAVCELTDARWIRSLRRGFLILHPLLLVLPLLFLALVPRLDLYPWAAEPTAWLNKPFFLARNLLLLVTVYLAGRRLLRHALARSGEAKRAAVHYLLAFVACQSLIAFDWIMSLEFPWISTLLGPYFFVEAVYGGFALGGVAGFLLYSAKPPEDRETFRGHLADLGNLIFGFSILWAGLFFAQFLLLWYGNLPEAARVVQERIAVSPYRELSWIFLAGCFGFPFLIFLSHRAKQRPGVIALVSVVILGGLLVERVVFVMPVLPLHGGVLAVQNLFLFVLWMLLLHSRTELLPGATTQR